jgi:aspartate aminotransferase-like enzyme
MRERYGVVISGGLEELRGRIIRIGHMANTASPEYLLPTITALELSLQELGANVEVGAGVAAAREVMVDG